MAAGRGASIAELATPELKLASDQLVSINPDQLREL
jgi:hypothetical protein